MIIQSGDIESDLIIGSDNTLSLLVMTDRATRITMLKRSVEKKLQKNATGVLRRMIGGIIFN